VPATVPGPAGLVTTVLAVAQAHFAEGRHALADAFLQLIRQPDAPPAATWQELGNLQFTLGEYEAAGRAYGYAAAYHPKDAGLQVRLARTCLRLDDRPNFEGYLQRALALDPDNSPALQLLAEVNQ
jgi:tetratricopeptide (TPR) repeat protein